MLFLSWSLCCTLHIHAWLFSVGAIYLSCNKTYSVKRLDYNSTSTMVKSMFGKIDEYDAAKEESTNNVEQLTESLFGINSWAKTDSLFLSYRCKVLQASTESGGARKAWQSFVQWPHENTYRSLQSSTIRDHQALSLIGNTGRLNNPSQLTWQSYTHWRSTTDTEAHWSTCSGSSLFGG